MQLDGKRVTHSFGDSMFRDALAFEGVSDAEIYNPYLHFVSERKGLDLKLLWVWILAPPYIS